MDPRQILSEIVKYVREHPKDFAVAVVLTLLAFDAEAHVLPERWAAGLAAVAMLWGWLTVPWPGRPKVPTYNYTLPVLTVEASKPGSTEAAVRAAEKEVKP